MEETAEESVTLTVEDAEDDAKSEDTPDEWLKRVVKAVEVYARLEGLTVDIGKITEGMKRASITNQANLKYMMADEQYQHLFQASLSGMLSISVDILSLLRKVSQTLPGIRTLIIADMFTTHTCALLQSDCSRISSL